MTTETAFHEARRLADRLQTVLIDGAWIAARSGKTLTASNPARGELIGQFAAGDAQDIDAAVAAARRSFDAGSWIKQGPTARAKILWRVAELIDTHREALAGLETLDNGMPLAKARGLVAFGAEMFRYCAGWCTKVYGQSTDLMLGGSTFHAYTRKEPVGVAGLITPWNVPFVMAANKIAAALAAGCSVVLKPAEDTSLSALRLGELLLEAGVPAGVVNIVTGLGAEAGAALAAHPDVDKIAFTGSTATGRRIVQSATGNMKKVTLELGGKSPVIVCEDADIRAAAPLIANGVFSNSGQICVAGSRVFVHRRRRDELLDALGTIARSIKVGDGFAADTQLGPIVSQRQLDRIVSLIDAGVGDGSEVIAGGQCLPGSGYFIAPTVLTEPRAGARILQEEIFGPVVNVLAFDDHDAALAAANATEYGLAAAIYTSDIKRAHRMAAAVRAGTVWLNTQLVMDPTLPFGGYKQSGWGREHGLDGIEAYMQTKAVIAGL